MILLSTKTEAEIHHADYRGHYADAMLFKFKPGTLFNMRFDVAEIALRINVYSR